MRTDHQRLADQLRATAADGRPQLAEQFVVRLGDELDALLGLLGEWDTQAAGVKRIDPAGGEYHAVGVLAFARYQPAAELFVRRIDTRSTAFPTESDEYQSDYPFFPFAAATAAVGAPALPRLAEVIATAEVGSTRFDLSCLVLREILGEELANALVGESAEPPRKERAARLFRLAVGKWEASSCTDYAIR
jgi:hypothetical protein